MRKYIVSFLIMLLCSTLFTDTRSQGTQEKSPLDKYLEIATITQMDWLLLNCKLRVYWAETLYPYENYTRVIELFFDYDTERIFVDAAIREERPLYYPDPDPFSGLPHIKKKEVVFDAVRHIKPIICNFIPEIEDDDRLLRIRFFSLTNYENTLAVYENGKLTPEW